MTVKISDLNSIGGPQGSTGSYTHLSEDISAVLGQANCVGVTPININDGEDQTGLIGVDSGNNMLIDKDNIVACACPPRCP